MKAFLMPFPTAVPFKSDETQKVHFTDNPFDVSITSLCGHTYSTRGDDGEPLVRLPDPELEEPCKSCLRALEGAPRLKRLTRR